jgi:hypothetical protein
MAEESSLPLLENNHSFYTPAGYEEEYDYVIVFQNPYCDDKDAIERLKQMVSAQESYEAFIAMFRLVTDLGYYDSGTELQDVDSKHSRILARKIAHQKKLTDCWEAYRDRESGGQFTKGDYLELVIDTFLKILQEDIKLQVKLFYSRDKDEIFCKIRASDENLKTQADLSDYKLQIELDRDNHPKGDFRQVAPYAPFEKRDEVASSSEIQFCNSDLESKFKKYNKLTQKKVREYNKGEHTVMRYKDRVRLIFEMINNYIDINSTMTHHIVVTHYPIHNQSELKDLNDNWARISNFWKRQDLKKIRLYFGEKVALYFAWMSFYNMWMLWPTVIGLGIFILQHWFKDLYDSSGAYSVSELSLMFFSIFLAVSSTVFDRLWARKEKELSWRWGMVNVEEVEHQRPQFKGVFKKDTISGRMKKISEPNFWDFVKGSMAFTVTLLFVGISISAISAIFIFRSTLGSDFKKYCGIINAFQIKVLNIIYRYIATWMNNWQNFETDNKYIDSLTIKLYLFTFVNSYASLVYVAFIKDPEVINGVKQPVMEALNIQLMYMCGTQMSLNLVELGLPYLKRKIRTYFEERKVAAMFKKGEDVRQSMSPVEKQSKLEDYEEPLDDYMEMVILYGNVVMFSAACPILPLLALILIVVEIRLDAWKLCNLCRRTNPKVTNSIGVWRLIIKTISYAGAFTNTAILVFTSDIFDEWSISKKWILFIALEHGLLLFKAIVSILVSETHPGNF